VHVESVIHKKQQVCIYQTGHFQEPTDTDIIFDLVNDVRQNHRIVQRYGNTFTDNHPFKRYSPEHYVALRLDFERMHISAAKMAMYYMQLDPEKPCIEERNFQKSIQELENTVHDIDTSYKNIIKAACAAHYAANLTKKATEQGRLIPLRN